MCEASRELQGMKKTRIGMNLEVAFVPGKFGNEVLCFAARNTAGKCVNGVCLKTDTELTFFLNKRELQNLNLAVGDQAGATVSAKFIEGKDSQDPRIKHDAFLFDVDCEPKLIPFDGGFLGLRAKIEKLPPAEMKKKTKRLERKKAIRQPRRALAFA
jgi:hypothetical protein